MHERFHYKTLDEVKAKAGELGIDLPLSEQVSLLKQPLSIGKFECVNRMAIQPMEGCDGDLNGAPSELTLRRYNRFAGSGAGLIWAEAVAVAPEGKANPRQLMLTKENLDQFKRLTEGIRERSRRLFNYEPVLVMQQTHSGRYSKPLGRSAPVIAAHNPILEEKNPVADDRIITDDELRRLEEKYGESARLAQEAGFDGVDVKACHRYLLNELLGAYERPGKYGGCFENRIRALCNSIEAVKANVSPDFLVTGRFNIYDGMPYPHGFGVAPEGGLAFDFREPVRLLEILHDKYGVEVVNLTLGNPYFSPHINRPFDMGPYLPKEHPFEGLARMCHFIGEVKKACPQVKIMSSGNSYLRQFSVNMGAGMLERGWADLIGFGRMALAYPEFAKDVLEKGSLDPAKCCVACSKCSQLMRAGSVAGCVVRDQEVYFPIYRENVLENEKDIRHEVSGM